MRQSEIRPPTLPFQGLHFELVGKGLLTGADRLPEQIGIHHIDYRVVIPDWQEFVVRSTDGAAVTTIKGAAELTDEFTAPTNSASRFFKVEVSLP